MMHAGLPPTVASNRSIQQRVRRLASKLDINRLLSSLDTMLQELYPSDHPLSQVPLDPDRRTMAAALIYLVAVSVKQPPLLSVSQCMRHAGMSLITANN
jgi:hypothetical protein